MKSRSRYFFIMFFVQFHQILTSGSEAGGGDGRVAMITECVRLAASIAYEGYSYLTQDKPERDLQIDVLDVPYKNMIYMQTQTIEQLFDDANKHDNPPLQIKALILLCRVAIPEWYFKSFSKGLEILYERCFDEQGNFVDATGLGDIRLIFKDYCKRTPASWQAIAKISPWWCKNKRPNPLYTQHYADTCTDYNEELLKMIEANQLEDLVYLKYLLIKNGSKTAYKIYDYQFSKFFKDSLNGFDSRK